MRWWQVRSLFSESPGNYKSYKPRFKTRQRVADAYRMWQRVPDWRCWKPERSTLGKVYGRTSSGMADERRVQRMQTSVIWLRIATLPLTETNKDNSSMQCFSYFTGRDVNEAREEWGREQRCDIVYECLHSNMKFIKTLYQEITPYMAITIVSMHYSKVNFNGI